MCSLVEEVGTGCTKRTKGEKKNKFTNDTYESKNGSCWSYPKKKN